MISERVMARLRWHAGLDDVSATEALPSMASATWPKGQMNKGLERALEDFLDTLSALNSELNSETPSETVTAKVANLPRSLVYSVTEVIGRLRECQLRASDTRHSEWFGRAAWRAEGAWSAVLAGDIDDIEKHLDDEEKLRFD